MDTDSFQHFIQNLTETYGSVIGLIGFIIVLIIISALITAAETCYLTISVRDIERQTEYKNNKRVLNLLQSPQQLNATLILSNYFTKILIVLLGIKVIDYFFTNIATETLKIIIAIILISFLIVLFTELIPKILAGKNLIKLAFIMAIPLQILNFLLSPATYFLIKLKSIVEKKLTKKTRNSSTEKFSKALELNTENTTTKEEQKLLEGIVTFGNTDTSQVMKPRMDIVAFSENSSFKEIIEQIIENGFSRNPVYNDNIDQIIGVLYSKDVLPYINEADFDWKQLMRKPFFVPENKKLDDLLAEFQTKKIHFAVVVDEYGGTSGIITLEDIIEEIVGDISDEFDDEDLFYTKIDQHNYLFDGKTTIKDFCRVMGIDEGLFEKLRGESETIAGFILEITGRFLRKNEEITFLNFKFKVELLDKKRIKQLKVTVL